MRLERVGLECGQEPRGGPEPNGRHHAAKTWGAGDRAKPARVAPAILRICGQIAYASAEGTKVGTFLTALATEDVAVSPQEQAFNPI